MKRLIILPLFLIGCGGSVVTDDFNYTENVPAQDVLLADYENYVGEWECVENCSAPCQKLDRKPYEFYIENEDMIYYHDIDINLLDSDGEENEFILSGGEISIKRVERTFGYSAYSLCDFVMKDNVIEYSCVYLIEGNEGETPYYQECQTAILEKVND